MVNNRNAQAAMVVSFAAIAVLGVLIVVVFGSSTAILAEEIVEYRGDDQSTARVAVWDEIELIPGVTLQVTSLHWSNSLTLDKSQWRGSRQVRVETLNPGLAFLVVDYKIDNRSDESLSREGLAELIALNHDSGYSVEATELEAIGRSDNASYRVGSQRESFDMVPISFYSGTWVFEADYRLSDLRLASDGIGFEIPVRMADFGSGN